MTELDYQAVKEVIRLLPEYSRTLDFDIITLAYQNVINEERKRYAQHQLTCERRRTQGSNYAHQD